MYMSGSVLLIKEHPDANKLIKMLEKMGGELPGELEKGARIYVQYGSRDKEPIDKSRVARTGSVFVHTEGNLFMCHKSANNKFIPGDEIYFLDSEIKESANDKK